MGSGDDSSSTESDEMIDILLIEPHSGDTRLFEENLRSSKFLNDFHAVSDGEEALEYLHQRNEYEEASRPDLILLEPQLPGKSGKEVVAELDDEPLVSEIPVVVLTGSETEAEIVKDNGLEADFFVQKPMEASDFLEFVQEIEELWLALVNGSESATK
ncbi:response regulator [Natronobacterium texcoconense]|uniref:Response regulator receiver domain-containing protein n=1 Tax=Natronobacterium texcoconense TaxID=1095778 RepID=A0A1H1GE71_NATTX|nr:response regulator [Natronobacterium texcoconense]SDR11198.1 Response regulator receiver domain-containing protein [Natronobacterium texcoconense]